MARRDDWAFANPVKIRFGEGCLDSLGGLLDGRPYILVTYGEAPFVTLRRRIEADAGPPRLVVDDIEPNPSFAYLEEACRRFTAEGVRGGAIVALGGGSVIDAAKVFAAAGGDFARVRAYLAGRSHQSDLAAAPIIALPTTAGTGSEVTSWATIWDPEAERKHSLNAPQLFPTWALVDPELTHGMPGGLTVATALDALSHALESLWNRNANPVSRLFAVSAARAILEILPALAENLDDASLRRRMAQAALFAGLAFSTTKTALAHALSYPVTLRHGVPHGIAAAFTLPRVMMAALGIDPACDAALREIFGADLEAGAARLEAFLGGLGVATSCTAYGIGEDEFGTIIDAALAGERGQNFIAPLDKVRASFAAGAEG